MVPMYRFIPERVMLRAEPDKESLCLAHAAQWSHEHMMLLQSCLLPIVSFPHAEQTSMSVSLRMYDALLCMAPVFLFGRCFREQQSAHTHASIIHDGSALPFGYLVIPYRFCRMSHTLLASLYLVVTMLFITPHVPCSSDMANTWHGCS